MLLLLYIVTLQLNRPCLTLRLMAIYLSRALWETPLLLLLRTTASTSPCCPLLGTSMTIVMSKSILYTR